MQYNLISGVVPVLGLDSDGNPNYHDVIVDLMINDERNVSIAHVIGTHHKTLVLTAQPSMHCEKILKQLPHVEKAKDKSDEEEGKTSIRAITREECDNIIQHQEPDTLSLTPFDHVPDFNDFIDQKALVMSFASFEKLLSSYSNMELEMLHTKEKNPAEAAIHAIFSGVDALFIATPHKDIDKMIEYAQFGFEVTPKKKNELTPRRGSSCSPVPHTVQASHLPRLPVTPSRNHSPGPVAVKTRNTTQEVHLPSVEKPPKTEKVRPDPIQHSSVPRHDETDFVHKSDHNNHYMAHPHTGMKKAHITLCEIGDNIEPYTHWCKWHSEKIARISTYDISTYRKDVHYQHKNAL